MGLAESQPLRIRGGINRVCTLRDEPLLAHA